MPLCWAFMLESKLCSHPQNRALSSNLSQTTKPRTQQRRMAMALILLVFALALVLFHERDFWFPDEMQVQDDTQQASLAATAKGIRQRHSASKAHGRGRIRPQPAVDSEESADMGPSVATTRMVLSPLEVEVLAADYHRRLRLGSNIVQVDLARASSLSRAKPRVFVESSPSGLR
jgi:hypothetical protein